MATKSVNEFAKPSPSVTSRRSSSRKSAVGKIIASQRKAAVESRMPEVRVTKRAPARTGFNARAGERSGRSRTRSLRALLQSRTQLAHALAPLHVAARELDRLLERADDIAQQWLSVAPEEVRDLSRQIISRVTLLPTQIELAIEVGRLARALGSSAATNLVDKTMITLRIGAVLQRAGKGKRMIIGDACRPEVNNGLVKILRQAFAARDLLLAPTDESINAIAARLGRSKGRLTSLIRLSYLAPDIVVDVLAGRQPAALSAKRLIRISPGLPLDWTKQRTFLGFH